MESGVPGSQRRGRRAEPDEPDPARAVHVPSSQPSAVLHREADARPTRRRGGDDQQLYADRLFEGQSPKFFKIVHTLAHEADAASRGSLYAIADKRRTTPCSPQSFNPPT